MRPERSNARASWPVGELKVPGFAVYAGMHPAASVLTRHQHELPTICSVQQGSFTEYYPGKAVSCGNGTLKVTPAGEPHWNRFDDVTTFGMRIDVDPARFGGEPSVRRLLDERVFLSAGVLGTLTQQIAAEVGIRDDVAPVAVEGLLLELLARMARLGGGRRAAMPRWLRQADDMVHGMYLQPLTVAGIAAEVGVHGSTLSRTYRRHFGYSIGRRIRRLRIEHAARRLVAEATPLSAIALDAGFYDQSHFTNVFRQQMGVTPAGYRQRHRNLSA